MQKKLLLRLGLIETLIFLTLFLYFYRKSGKFRQSIIASFVAVVIYFSNLRPAFTPQNHQHHGRLQKQNGIFSGKSNKSGSGSGSGEPGDPDKPNDSGGDGLPKFPRTEPVEQTTEHYENIERLLHSMESISDTDDTDTENQCEYGAQRSNPPASKNNINIYIKYEEFLR